MRLIILLIISGLINYTLKEIFAWERPSSDLWLVSVVGFSFPSFHAMAAVIFWGFLAHEIKKWWFTATTFVMIVLIPLSRIYLGVHYPQDIIAGISEGILILYIYEFTIKYFIKLLEHMHELFVAVFVILITVSLLFLDPTETIASGGGLVAGLSAGYILEPHLADFDPNSNWTLNILKIITGTIISFALWQGCEWLFPSSIGFEWFRAFIIGIWVACGAPWIFVQFKLTLRE